jgi:PIN domain nuclease of toxin-antitoxin system
VRVLADTHAMYWYIEGDAQLSATARTLIQDASNEILISPASYWENRTPNSCLLTTESTARTPPASAASP